MEIIVFLSIVIAVVAVLTSIVLVRRVKKQIAEMTDALVDVKNGNGNRRILSATNELTAPLAYEINEIVVSYESRLSIVRQTEETNRQLIIHTRKAIPLNSKQKKRIGFELSAYGGKNMMYRTELVEGITVENVIEKINAKIEEMEKESYRLVTMSFWGTERAVLVFKKGLKGSLL